MEVRDHVALCGCKPLRRAPSIHRGKAEEADAERCDRGRHGHQFRDHDLAVAHPEIGEKGLISPGVERAAVTTDPVTPCTTSAATQNCPDSLNLCASGGIG